VLNNTEFAAGVAAKLVGCVAAGRRVLMVFQIMSFSFILRQPFGYADAEEWAR